VGVGAAGAVVVAGGVVVAGAVTVGAVVGGWIAGSDFSPQPVAARATASAIKMIGGHKNRRRTDGRSRAPAFAPRVTRAP
jgi:hypothetical protein